jgi:hypothetical protein
MSDQSTKRVTITITVEIYERVKKTAQEENRTFAGQATQLMIEAFTVRDAST